MKSIFLLEWLGFFRIRQMSLALKYVKPHHTEYDVMKQNHMYKYRTLPPDSFIRVLVGSSQ